MKYILRSFFLFTVLSSLWACNQNASSLTSKGDTEPRCTNNCPPPPVDPGDPTAALKGMVIAQKPIVNLGYACGYGETIKEGKTESDDTLFEYATFSCPVLSDSIIFYIGSSIETGLVVGSFPFYDLEVKALNTISLVDFIDAYELLTYEHPYVTNVALLLDAVSIRDHQGALNEVLRIPDEIHAQVSLWVDSQGEYFDSSAGFFIREPWQFGADISVRDFQEDVVAPANLASALDDNVNGLVDASTYFTENAESVVADLQAGGRILYTAVYPLSLLAILDETNVINGDFTLYIDRVGRPFGYGLLIDMDTSDVAAGQFGDNEVLYFKTLENKLTDDGVLDNSLSLQAMETPTLFDLTGRMIRRILFHGKYTFADVLPLYDFHSFADSEAGRFKSEVNKHNQEYTGAVAMRQERQVAPLIPEPILESFDFPFHYSMTFYKKGWFNEDWAIDDEELKVATLSVTFLKDGNIITDLDNDCAAVNFDTLEEDEAGGITEVPLGFLGHGTSLDLGPMLLDESERTAEQNELLSSITGNGELLQFVSLVMSFSHESIIGLGDRTGLPQAKALESQMGLDLYGSLSTQSWQLFGSDETLLALDWYNKKRVYKDFSQALPYASASVDGEDVLITAQNIGFEGIVKGVERTNCP